MVLQYGPHKIPDSRRKDQEGQQLSSRKGPLKRKVAWGCRQKDYEVGLVERGVEDKLFGQRTHFTLSGEVSHGLLSLATESTRGIHVAEIHAAPSGNRIVDHLEEMMPDVRSEAEIYRGGVAKNPISEDGSILLVPTLASSDFSD